MACSILYLLLFSAIPLLDCELLARISAIVKPPIMQDYLSNGYEIKNKIQWHLNSSIPIALSSDPFLSIVQHNRPAKEEK